MSLARHFSLLRSNIWSAYPVRLLKKQAGYLSGKLFDPRSYEKRHFTTRVQTLETNILGHLVGPNLSQTTGFFHKNHRIIEIALRDLSGGKDCTFETLNNPEQSVPQYVSAVTRIGTDLVCRPDIPRFSDVLPVLLAYFQSRQVPGKPVLWVAHNAKKFDVPFLAKEFQRCSAEIPAYSVFVDSLSLPRKLVKSEGEKASYKVGGSEGKTMVSVLKTVHRAMQDVTILSQIVQKITFDLKLTYKGLGNESIGAFLISNFQSSSLLKLLNLFDLSL